MVWSGLEPIALLASVSRRADRRREEISVEMEEVVLLLTVMINSSIF